MIKWSHESAKIVALEVLVSKSRIDRNNQIQGIHISLHLRINYIIIDAEIETLVDSLNKGSGLTI
jgi:hypothetical protein